MVPLPSPTAAATRPAATLLLPLWDAASIERFARASLPSLLAEGNVPALVDLLEFTFCILTTAEGQQRLNELPGIDDLRQIATLVFVPIDDLVLDSHFAVTPTLAYLRAINSENANPTGTSFILWNSEFVVAAGALSALARRIVEGHRVLLANVILADAQRLLTRLKPRQNSNTVTLDIAPRELVHLAFESLHPLEAAAFVNSRMPVSIHSGRFFWHVDSTTVIARHFSPTLLCIRPERTVETVGAFFDASFAPEMCPSATPLALRDSDEFFAVEMRDPGIGYHDLSIGRTTLEDTGRALSTWVTSHHCQLALNQSFIVHARDIPASARAVAHTAEQYVRQLTSIISPVLKSHEHHPHWFLAFYLWKLRHFELNGGPAPLSPFMTGTQVGKAGLLRGMDLSYGLRRKEAKTRRGRAVARLVRLLAGRRPFLRPWHPDWLDYRPVAAVLREFFRRPSLKCFYVKDDAGNFDVLDIPHTATHEDVLGAFARPPRDVDVLLIDVDEAHLPNIETLIQRMRPFVRQGGVLIAYYRHLNPATRPDLSPIAAWTLGASSTDFMTSSSVRFAGGESKQALRNQYGRVLTYLTSRRPRAILRALLILGPLLLRTVMLNRKMAEVQDSGTSVYPVSSVVVTVRV